MDEMKKEKMSWSFTPVPEQQRTHLGCGYYADVTTDELNEWFRHHIMSFARELYTKAQTQLQLVARGIDLDVETAVHKCMEADHYVFQQAEAWHKALLAKRAEQESQSNDRA